MNIYTRSDGGVIKEHLNIESAMEHFVSDDGYRIDFIFPDGRSVYIRRDYEWSAHVEYNNPYEKNVDDISNVLSMMFFKK